MKRKTTNKKKQIINLIFSLLKDFHFCTGPHIPPCFPLSPTAMPGKWKSTVDHLEISWKGRKTERVVMMVEDGENNGGYCFNCRKTCDFISCLGGLLCLESKRSPLAQTPSTHGLSYVLWIHIQVLLHYDMHIHVCMRGLYSISLHEV